ncbi:MAG: fumarate hydratase C-terminal domain-containing protein [Holophagae bacterium]|nr:fumarate hydratase C-terminal domain-containing protein [Holophagae bacterium]
MSIKINLPVSEEDVRKLKIGDEVLLNGTMITSRDMAHKLMHEEKPDFIRPFLKNSMIYHCGPVVKKNENGEYSFVAAGPTTSTREEPYQADVIDEYQVRGVIGKGGMGAKTLAGLKKTGAVYLHAVGGLGTLLAQCVIKVIDVFKLEEFGSPEAFWIIEVKDFPVVVTMDSHGNSLHETVLEKSMARSEELLANG